ncbi:MAG: N-acetylglucosamine-6-phosphate deacetylase [Roseinatronobacter sp.]
MTRFLQAETIFDGHALHRGLAVALDPDGLVAGLHPAQAAGPISDLGAVLLVPGMVDLQVNGGGGAMVGADTDVAQLAAICAIHARLGSTAILPTLITDRPEVTRAVLHAGRAAAKHRVAGFAGLHLEGPHLDPARKGAHDPKLIRPMTEEDLAALCDAAQDLPALLVTLAPEAVTPDQIARLARAGVRVSLGHSNCDTAAARAAHRAGATLVTHLFNAMGPLAARAPGLVGAALTLPLRAGLIADGVHVAPEAVAIALAIKPADDLFLVSDAMAVAGTNDDTFTLGERRIHRRNGILTLSDGTLAGADTTLARSVGWLVGQGVTLSRALAMATRVPADVIGATDRGHLRPGARADLVALDAAFQVVGVWQAGQRLV